VAYEELWRARYGQELAGASELLQQNTASNVGAHEILFQLGLMAAMQGVEA